NQLDRWSLGRAARVITVSRAFARDLERVGVPSERISVLHNSIDSDWSSAVESEDVLALKRSFGISNDERVVIAVGRLSREKAHADLVAALAHLRLNNPQINARLIIVGEGPERERIEQIARALAISDKVVFAGHVINVSKYYAMSDVMVLPSHSEGSPNALLEAMAAGLPVIATEVGGVPEIVAHNRSALLVAPGDTGAMGKAIEAALTDKELAERLAAGARAEVLANHSPEVRLRSLARIYTQLVSPPGIQSVECEAGNAKYGLRISG